MLQLQQLIPSDDPRWRRRQAARLRLPRVFFFDLSIRMVPPCHVSPHGRRPVTTDQVRRRLPTSLESLREPEYTGQLPSALKKDETQART